jgi:hypothetical protein
MNAIPIRIAISEPWDLGEATSWQAQSGSLLRVENESGREIGLISLADGLSYQGRNWPYLLVCPRSGRIDLFALDSRSAVPCNFIGLIEAPAEAGLSDALEKWRGGLAFVGDLTLAPTASLAS